MIVACATDDGINFTSRHFGDAVFYRIYKIEKNLIEFIKEIQNTTEEEKHHADPKKAKGIIDLLKEEEVNVAITKVFGPNIKRITKHLLPIIANSDCIEVVLKTVQNDYDRIHEILKNKRTICLNLKTNKEVAINE